MTTKCMMQDDNIERLRDKYGDALHWVVGDTHGETRTLQALMKKIGFAPDKDSVFFVGDYNAGADVAGLMQYMSEYYQPDYALAGFHMIRGNHERELFPMYALDNMPDIIVIRGRVMNYYIVHAGMVRLAFDKISEDMKQDPEKRFFAYKLEDACTMYDAPLRQIIWSRRGLYSQRSRWKQWPDEYALYQNKACIIHGHTPYCFFDPMLHAFYGDKSLFWEQQHIWFSEDLQSFDIDSNIKGVSKFGPSRRGLSCICLEALEDIAAKDGQHLNINSIVKADNFVFHETYLPESAEPFNGNLRRILDAKPVMKKISVDSQGMALISEI